MVVTWDVQAVVEEEEEEEEVNGVGNLYRMIPREVVVVGMVNGLVPRYVLFPNIVLFDF
jgi:hypothetical protein